MIRLLVIVLLLAGFWALTLWKASRHELQAEATHPPLGDFITIDGHRVHYLQKGTGPDLVLIHGASGNLRDWTFDTVDRLADRYRVTVFDRPGLGYTDRITKTGATITQQADFLVKAARQVGVTQPIVLGQSYGGAVALAWAVNHPDDLSALVLLAAASMPWDGSLPTYYRVTSHPVLGPMVVPLLTAWVPDRVVENAIDETFLPQPTPIGYHDYIGAGLTLRRVSMRANALQRANLLEQVIKLRPGYDRISVPTEILHGDADTIVGLHIHSEPLSRIIPGSVLTVLDGIGHCPQHVAIAQVDAAIDRAAHRAGLR